MKTLVTCMLGAYLVVTTKKPTTPDPASCVRSLYMAIQMYSFGMIEKVPNDTSTVVSAFSLFPVLGQLALATKRGTASYAELMRTISANQIGEETAIQVAKIAYERVANTNGVKIKLANKLYIEKSPKYQINEHLLAASKTMFQSELGAIAFESPEQAAHEINQWVKTETRYNTKELVSPKDLSKETMSLLVDSLYFKARWETPFNPNLTSVEPFHNGHKTIQVSMMHRTGPMRYLETKIPNNDCKLLELPYKGNEAALLFVLPKNKTTSIDLRDSLKNIDTILQAAKNDQFLDNKTVIASIPKFKIEKLVDLAELLPKLGLKSTFHKGEAHLSRLLKPTNHSTNLEFMHVSKAFQKNNFEINESGTQTSSVSDAIENLDVTEEKPVVFNANTPFGFVLHINHTVLLLLGAYYGE